MPNEHAHSRNQQGSRNRRPTIIRTLDDTNVSSTKKSNETPTVSAPTTSTNRPHTGARRTAHVATGRGGTPRIQQTPTRTRGRTGAPQQRRSMNTVAPRSASRLPARRREQSRLPAKLPDDLIPAVPENAVRIVPLGGVEEVGKNMIVVETPEDILVSDCGFQFISEEEQPGVDYILPNTKYLEDRKEKVRGIIITHGHLDHIGGIPFIMDRIGNPPIYCTEVTALLIKKRQEEYPHLPKLDIHVVDRECTLKIGSTPVHFFPVTHSISDSCGVSIETKYGNVVISGDLKLDHEDGTPSSSEVRTWGRIGSGNNIVLYADSTNAERGGFSIPESVVHRTLEEIITDVKGRLTIGTFASQFERLIHIIQVCERLNKKIITEGRSIKNNLEIARLANRVTIRPDTIIPADEIGNYPADRIVILATGAQGEEFAALMRIATKKHRSLTLNERDTVVLSSSVIPGNELSVQRLKDNLYRHGVRIIHYRASDVHSTGHGNSGELVWIREQVKPKFFIPGYGYHSMLRCHAQANVDAGFPKENICIPDNGTIIDFIEGNEMRVLKEKAPSTLMMVDGLSIGDVQDVVIRDRRTLAQDGMFVIIATVNARTGELRKSPDIISRGFVYLRESQELLGEARVIVKKAIVDTTKGANPIDFEYVKRNISEAVSRFLLQKTNKRPIVIPVVLGL
ncbi:MAG: ribonuclease J [Candidatus Pacebacteria bacterium]|nr:ribonuclease J [Candidatus Paceibacterota bacterium]